MINIVLFLNKVKYDSNNYRNKKGFTLIELLAVIVILAIIALIATPLILNVIDESRKSVFIESVRSAMNATELYSLKDNFPLPGEDGNVSISVTDNNLNLKNNPFQSGAFIIDDNGNISASDVTNKTGEYCVNGKISDLKLVSGDECINGASDKPILQSFVGTKINSGSIEVALTVEGDGENVAFYSFRIAKKGEKFGEWIKVIDSNVHTFGNLEPETMYVIEGTATSLNNIQAEKYMSIDVTTNQLLLVEPIIEIDKNGWSDPSWTNKDVKVKIIFEKNSAVVNRYSIDNGGTFIDATEEVINLNIQANAIIVAITEAKGNGSANKTVSSTINSIDKVAPVCLSSGGQTTWTTSDVNLIGTCSDDTSGCVGNVSKKYNNDIMSIQETPGVVKDFAGNEANCPANQIVKRYTIEPTTSNGMYNIVSINIKFNSSSVFNSASPAYNEFKNSKLLIKGNLNLTCKHQMSQQTQSVVSPFEQEFSGLGSITIQVNQETECNNLGVGWGNAQVNSNQLSLITFNHEGNSINIPLK